MRFRHPDGQTIHLGYCTNVHPAEALPGILGQLERYAGRVRRRLDTAWLGLGLWLPAPVAAALAADPGERRRLRKELATRGLEVFTLNGFPYRAFHAPVVKHAVYQPDWTTRRRLRYTLDLARVLADLLPDGAARGSVSTLPLAWRHPWDDTAAAAAAARLAELAAGLAELERQTGRPVRVGFEPEPGCLVETTSQAADRLAGLDPDRLGVCLDLAHLACAWEEPAGALARLAAARLPVVKVQVSAALAVNEPAAARELLRDYAEPRFLHQTRPAAGGGFDDLPDALDVGAPGPWRIHFHVPLHADPGPPLSATHPVTRAALAALLGGAAAGCDHFEVETYTWEVLPVRDRPGTPAALAAGIAAELGYARDELRRLGLSMVEVNR
jgi:sugar phosphate isomerase/epimerase